MLEAEVHNTGAAPAFSTGIHVRGSDGKRVSGGPLQITAGGSAMARAPVTAPIFPPRQPGEDDDVYRGRLRSADGAWSHLAVELDWKDGAGNRYGPISTSIMISSALPILDFVLRAPRTAAPGAKIQYFLECTNTGGAAAVEPNVTIVFPDGTSRRPALPAGPLPPGGKVMTSIDYTVPSGHAPGPMMVRAEIRWHDVLKGSYGPLSAYAVTAIEAAARQPAAP
jgi:hypothetical protein